MKYLIVYAHPNSKSFCHAVMEEVESAIKANGGEYEVRDLYQMGFSPSLSSDDFIHFLRKETPQDILTEQGMVRQADRIVFIYPVWWFSMPAILKGYIDRVFSRGFAYDTKGRIIKGLLKNKKVMIFCTTGGPKIAYFLFGYKAAIKKTIDSGIFNVCGMRVILHKYLYAVPSISDTARKKMLEKIRKMSL